MRQDKSHTAVRNHVGDVAHHPVTFRLALNLEARAHTFLQCLLHPCLALATPFVAAIQQVEPSADGNNPELSSTCRGSVHFLAYVLVHQRIPASAPTPGWRSLPPFSPMILRKPMVLSLINPKLSSHNMLQIGFLHFPLRCTECTSPQRRCLNASSPGSPRSIWNSVSQDSKCPFISTCSAAVINPCPPVSVNISASISQTGQAS